MIEKMIFLSSLNWYRHQWASRSFNEPDNLVYFLIGQDDFPSRPLEPQGQQGRARGAGHAWKSTARSWKKRLSSRPRARGAQDRTPARSRSTAKRKRLFTLISQLVALNNMLARRKSVESGNTLLKKFLRPGYPHRGQPAQHGGDRRGNPVQGQDGLPGQGYPGAVVSMRRSSRWWAGLRQALSEGSMELFQQLQAFRVAHGLNNLATMPRNARS